MCQCLAGVHARNQEFYSGGGGPSLTAGKQSGQRFCVFFFFFYSPELILQLTEGVQWFLQRKLCFSKDPEEIQNFPGGGGLTFSLC